MRIGRLPAPGIGVGRVGFRVRIRGFRWRIRSGARPQHAVPGGRWHLERVALVRGGYLGRELGTDGRWRRKRRQAVSGVRRGRYRSLRFLPVWVALVHGSLPVGPRPPPGRRSDEPEASAGYAKPRVHRAISKPPGTADPGQLPPAGSAIPGRFDPMARWKATRWTVPGWVPGRGSATATCWRASGRWPMPRRARMPTRWARGKA